MSDITVVIPTFNCLKYLRLCISSLRQCSFTSPELLVVVDGSEDGTVEWLQSEHIPYLYRWEHKRPPAECNGGNRGTLISRCYANLDLGGTLVRTPIVYFGNDDTVFSPGWDVGLAEHVTDDNLVANQIVEPGVEVPPWQGIIKHNCGANIGEFDLGSWMAFCTHQAAHKELETWGLNIGIMCKRKMFIERVLPRGGWYWMDSPPENMWKTFPFVRVCGVPLYHFSGRSSRLNGQ